MQHEFFLESLRQIDAIAKEILSSYEDDRVFCLIGDLGAGKTTLTQAFCRHLQVTDAVVSPTYTIINEYVTKDKKKIYHADLYRIKSIEEAIDTGIEDYLFSGQYCFVEWPQIITTILPFKFIKLDIKNLTEEGRTIIGNAYGRIL